MVRKVIRLCSAHKNEILIETGMAVVENYIRLDIKFRQFAWFTRCEHVHKSTKERCNDWARWSVYRIFEI